MTASVHDKRSCPTQSPQYLIDLIEENCRLGPDFPTEKIQAALNSPHRAELLKVDTQSGLNPLAILMQKRQRNVAMLQRNLEIIHLLIHWGADRTALTLDQQGDLSNFKIGITKIG
jgi:hypothetical protein